MVDYVDALYEHHQPSGAADAKARGAYIHDLMRAHEVKLLQPLLDYLGDKNSVRMLGPRDANIKAPTVAVLLQKRGDAVAAELASRGIMAGGGNFYGVRCLEGLGVDPDHGVLRLSFVHYTHEDEVQKLITTLDEIL